MSTPEQQLADFVTSLSYEDMPDSARETVRRAFVDTVGVTLAGAVDEAGTTAFETNGLDSDEVDPATLLGIHGDVPPETRAFRTGTASHALDYDDVSWAMDGHPSVTLVPPLLSLADPTDASGKDLATAYAAGFEVACALAAPISPEHYEEGWHATATFGALGAAAASAALLDLDTEHTRHALNIAASMPAGLKRNFGSMTKPLHAGLCSRTGVTAARLAASELTADATAISGEKGFWDLYGPDQRGEFSFDPAAWTLTETGIHVKYYPCCYFTHTSITATQAIVESNNLDPDDVEEINVQASQGAADALHHTDPETGLEAKFSMEYTVAAGVVRDRVGLAAFEDEAITDPAVQTARDRVEFTVDHDLHYDSHAAAVEIRTGDGSYERSQTDPPGTHENPLSGSELRAKFDECATRAIDSKTAGELATVFTDLYSCENIADAVRNAESTLRG